MNVTNQNTWSLTELANHFGTDKGTVGPSTNWGAHNYTDIYEAYFAPLREAPITLLEIGMGIETKIAHGRNATGGASIRMWETYFPNAKIYGCDIRSATFLDNERVHTFVVDQGSLAAWTAWLEANPDLWFDIVIDDGSHLAEHQQLTFSMLFPRVKPQGYYIIEDLNDKGAERNSQRPVVSTRHLFKQYFRNGLPQPHAIQDRRVLDDIATATFHVPKIGVSPIRHVHKLLRGLPGRPMNPLRFKPDSEKLCVIRKR